MAFPTVALSDYLQMTADLLHVSAADAYGYWGQAKLIRFINDAKRKRDLLTGAYRTLVSLALTIGQEAYTFTNTAGMERAFDVNAIYLTYGNQRIVLGQVPFTELTRDQRVWTNYQSVPTKFAKLTPYSVYLAPTPGVAYATVWDVSSYTADLAATTDTDALPYPYTEPIPYGAAQLAKIDERQYDEADWFEDQFFSHLSEAVLAKTGVVPNYYRMQRR